MSNVATIYSLQCQRSYERDGYNEAVNALKQSAGRFETFSDGLLSSRTALSAKAEVVTNAAVRVYMLSAAMPSGATTNAYIQLFKTSTGSVTLGTTPPDFQVEISSTESITIHIPQGRLFSGALSMACTTLASGSVAANTTNTPTVTLLYK